MWGWGTTRLKQPRHRAAASRCLPLVETLEARLLLTELIAEPLAVAASEFAEARHAVDHMELTPLPRQANTSRSLPPPPFGAVLHPLSSLPVLNSNPEAEIQIYLDFNGHVQATWGGRQNIQSPPYSLDNELYYFSDEELAAIEEIFGRVAEDFAPFQVNVTTIEPASLENGQGLRVVISGRWQDWLGYAAGGVAFIDSFYDSDPNVAYTFSETLASAANVAEATSHEAGHVLGLAHQSSYGPGGNKLAEYSSGDSTAAPIMGVSYHATRSRWWTGTSTSSTTYQADLEVLSQLEYRVDDYANTLGDAHPLEFLNQQTTIAGIIEQAHDVDVFQFEITTGDDLRIDYQAALWGANLDANVELRTSTGLLITEQTTFHEDTLSLGHYLEPGSYRLLIRNDGNYGSLGQYSLTLTVGNPPNLPPTLPGAMSGIFLSPAVVEFSWLDALGEADYLLQATRAVGKKTESFAIELPADTSSFVLQHYGVLVGWEFTLTARNDLGSATTSSLIPDELPLGDWGDVQAEAFTTTSLVASWTAVPGAMRYQVQIAAAETPESVLYQQQLGGTQTEVVVCNLTPGSEYLVTVIAWNSLGELQHDPLPVTLPNADSLDPLLAAPTQLAASSTTAFHVELEWSPAVATNWLEIQQKVGQNWVTLRAVAGSETQAELIPSGNKRKAKFRIVASNGHSTATSETVKIKRPAVPWRRYK